MITFIVTTSIIVLVASIITIVEMRANRRMKQLENVRLLQEMIGEVERELERIDNQKKE
tara:strand:- start:3306 stop:3482 length:177 start_codon:yes stop_codon:yes gene_type:complete